MLLNFFFIFLPYIFEVLSFSVFSQAFTDKNIKQKYRKAQVFLFSIILNADSHTFDNIIKFFCGKEMYRGKQNQTFCQAATTISSRVGQSQTECLQKEVEVYTRKFEEEKRKLFRVQENHREVLKGYQTQIDEFENLKAKKYRTQILTLNSQLKRLEIDLDKGISSYNDSLSKNNSLKSEIDQLRKHRKNQIQTGKRLRIRIEELEQMIRHTEEQIEQKKEELDRFKYQILRIQQDNQGEALSYQQNVENVEKSVCEQTKVREIKNQTSKQNAQTSDSQPIVKLRLRNLIHKNKERIRVTQQYKKNMEMIAQSFEQIRKQSGITTLQEVTKTFLKQEEQSTFIFQYISKLTNELEVLKEENTALRDRIEKQQEKNDGYRILLNGTPEKKKRQRQIEKYVKQKLQPIDSLNNLFRGIETCMFDLFKEFNIQTQQKQITFFNYQELFAQAETIINSMINQVHEISEQPSQQITKYSKTVPWFIPEEVREKNQESLLEPSKLHQYASQFWQRKKIGK